MAHLKSNNLLICENTNILYLKNNLTEINEKFQINEKK